MYPILPCPDVDEAIAFYEALGCGISPVRLLAGMVRCSIAIAGAIPRVRSGSSRWARSGQFRLTSPDLARPPDDDGCQQRRIVLT
jgi:hypothetical protein